MVFIILKEYFGEIPLEQLLYYLHAPLDETNVSAFCGAVAIAGVIVIVAYVIVFLSDFLLRRLEKQLGDAVFPSRFGVIMGEMLNLYLQKKKGI